MANNNLLLILVVIGVLLLSGGFTGNAIRLPYRTPTYSTSTTPTDSALAPQVTTQTQCPTAPATNQQLNTLLAQLSTTQRMIVSIQKNMMPQLAEGEGGTPGGPYCGLVGNNGLVTCGIQCTGSADCTYMGIEANCGYFNCVNK